MKNNNNNNGKSNDEWFTLDEIQKSDTNDTLYCLSVDSPDRQFLIGNSGIPTHNTEEGKEQDKLKGEANMIIGSIARLGRAAGVHLVIATQRPDAKLIPGETKANLGVRVNCGTTNSTASSMILENAEGTRVKANPRGRLYLQIYGKGDHGQGFFADQSWIDDYLESKGLNKDGTPIVPGGKQSRLAHVANMSDFEGSTLDDRDGIDNSAVIDQIRADEASEDFDNISEGFENDSISDSDENVDSFDDAFDEIDYDFDDSVEEVSAVDDKLGRPEFSAKKEDPLDKWHRPEDDWDDDLEDLIEENFAGVDFDDVPYDSEAFEEENSGDE